MQRLQKFLNVSILATEASHIFCCALPTLFSILSLLAGIGIISAVPAGIMFMHDIMHDWEIPIIVFSGLMIALGWALHDYSKRLDCRGSGCAHEPCEPKKNRSAKILKIATVLFLVNIVIYFGFHARMEAGGHDHHGHDHHNHGAHEKVVEAEPHKIIEADPHAGHDHHDHHGHDH